MPKLEEVIRRDTLANRPSANAVATGTLFFDTTNSILYRSNGTSWDSVEGTGGSGHDLLSATHSDTSAAAVSRGSLIVGNGTPAWGELVVGTSGQVLTSDGTDAAWATLSSDPSLASGQNEFNDASLTTQIWEHIVAGDNITIVEGANGESIQISASSPVIPAGSNGLLTGGNVLFISGLQFLVSAATYRINGTDYASPQATITLNAADGTNPRIDAIIVNSSNVATFITGTPATSPAAPSIDPETQIALTFVLVPANSTTPGNVSQTPIYLENTEWTSSTNASARITLNSSTDPFAGSVSIETTLAVAGDRFQFTSTAVNPTSYNTLNFLIKNKTAWANNKSISIVFLNGSGNPIGNVVTLDNGFFGFDHANVANYQLISIATSAFAAGASVSGLRFTVVGSGAGLSFFMDNIILQGGASTVTLPDGIMLFRGDWSYNITYSIDDVVTDSGVTYIALASSSNVHPSDSTTLWRRLSFGDDFVDGSQTIEPFEVKILNNNQDDAIEFIIDGGGSAITTGIKGDLEIPFPCTITAATLLADQSGSIVVDIWKDTYANYPPTVADSITASAKPTISTATKAQDFTLTGWTTSISAGDTLRFNVDSITTCTRVTLSLRIMR